MEAFQRRIKELFPSVLLTLLSIMQALCLEIQWSALPASSWLFEPGVWRVLGWLQVVGVIGGVLLVWLFYSSIVMRVAWIPTGADLVFPLLIGFLEFALVSSQGPGTLAIWCVLMASVFALSNFASFQAFRRARREPENRFFFEGVASARRRDSRVAVAFVSVILLVAAAVMVAGEQSAIAVVGVGFIAILIVVQFAIVMGFWSRTVRIATGDALRESTAAPTSPKHAADESDRN